METCASCEIVDFAWIQRLEAWIQIQLESMRFGKDQLAEIQARVVRDAKWIPDILNVWQRCVKFDLIEEEDYDSMVSAFVRVFFSLEIIARMPKDRWAHEVSELAGHLVIVERIQCAMAAKLKAMSDCLYKSPTYDHGTMPDEVRAMIKTADGNVF